ILPHLVQELYPLVKVYVDLQWPQRHPSSGLVSFNVDPLTQFPARTIRLPAKVTAYPGLSQDEPLRWPWGLSLRLRLPPPRAETAHAALHPASSLPDGSPSYDLSRERINRVKESDANRPVKNKKAPVEAGAHRLHTRWSEVTKAWRASTTA